MNAEELFQLLPERPELLLALALSAPARSTHQGGHRFSVEITDDNVVIRAPLRKVVGAQRAMLLCTKETICSAIFLHTLWRQNGGPEYEPYLANQIVMFAEELAEQNTTEIAGLPFSAALFASSR